MDSGRCHSCPCQCRQPWLGMSGFVSVGYTPQTTDICVCRRHVENVGLRHIGDILLCRPFFSCPQSCVGETVADTVSYRDVGISSRNSKGIVGKYLCTGFRQDFLPRVRVDTKWVHKLLMTEWSVSHKTKINTSSQRMWLACF